MLPWATFAFLFAALYVRMIRANTMETLNEDYVRTARAKGAPEWRVHALARAAQRAARRRDDARDGHRARARRRRSSPRSVFGLPGLGKVAIESIYAYDLPVTQGIVVFATFAIIIFNLIVDLVYAGIDPRIRLVVSGAAPGQRPADVLPHGRRRGQSRRRRHVQRRQGQDTRASWGSPAAASA